MRTTANFIVWVTLLQYLLVNLQQPIEQVHKLTDTDIICKPKTSILTMLGVNTSDAQWVKHFGLETNITDPTLKNEMLLDTIPFLVFQIMIFYYDYYLARLSFHIESRKIERGDEPFYFYVDTPQGRKIIIDFLKWKNTGYKFTEAFINVCYTRIFQ